MQSSYAYFVTLEMDYIRAMKCLIMGHGHFNVTLKK